MKSQNLTAILCGLFSMAAITVSAQNQEVESTVVVLKVNELDEDSNMALHSHFRKSASFQLINSCEALELVVFNSEHTLATAQHLIRQELNSIGILEMQFIEDKSATEVMIECRQRMRELLDPDGIE